MGLTCSLFGLALCGLWMRCCSQETHDLWLLEFNEIFEEAEDMICFHEHLELIVFPETRSQDFSVTSFLYI